jgi:hypothetical protein
MVTIKECMENLPKSQFEYECDFKAYLTIELRKRISSVLVEYNILNLYLNNIEEYRRNGYIFTPNNSAPVAGIAINYEGIFYPIELKIFFIMATRI